MRPRDRLATTPWRDDHPWPSLIERVARAQEPQGTVPESWVAGLKECVRTGYLDQPESIVPVANPSLLGELAPTLMKERGDRGFLGFGVFVAWCSDLRQGAMRDFPELSTRGDRGRGSHDACALARHRTCRAFLVERLPSAGAGTRGRGGSGPARLGGSRPGGPRGGVADVDAGFASDAIVVRRHGLGRGPAVARRRVGRGRGHGSGRACSGTVRRGSTSKRRRTTARAGRPWRRADAGRCTGVRRPHASGIGSRKVWSRTVRIR